MTKLHEHGSENGLKINFPLVFLFGNFKIFSEISNLAIIHEDFRNNAGIL